MTQAYYRSWRPLSWKEIIGQQHVTTTLQNAINNGRIVHAYLFAGPRGTGKTTTARVLAKAVNCLDPDPAVRPCNKCELCTEVNNGRFLDLIEIDAASNTSVEDVRELRDKIGFAPSRGSYKIYIIDEVHMLSGAAFNALLKTLEEPPAHAIFILATTELQKIPATILSRCQRYEFRRISVTEMVAFLQPKIAEEKIAIEDSALLQIARQATGSMRDAISMLDQLASGGKKITLTIVQSLLGTAISQHVVELFDSIAADDAAHSLKVIQKALDSGTDPRQFARQMVDYLRNLILIRAGNQDQVDVDGELLQQMQKSASKLDSTQILQLMRHFNQAANDARSNWQPGLAMEVAALESVEQELTERKPPKNSPPPAIATQVSGKEEITNGPTTQGMELPPVQEPAIVEPPHQSVGVDEGQKDSNLIIQKWKEICQAVSQLRRNTGALLNSSKPMIKNGILSLGFQSDLLKSKMEANDNLQVTLNAIEQVCGHKVTIECDVVSPNAQAVPSDLGIDGDGLVGTGLNQGGRIVHKD